ncbi:cell envelope biogenesis protein TolA [Pantoea alhagi]|uniref:cell envelope integrity protein TolA n=1 Tax=Pantoea alhagi TaxID=1891675 RepID=UPI00202B99DF|nr:cell envelope integrity protein TolA [Pantoea alhagi]URQ61745.1 cell envelope biogenesis protein TolA [Pantoea alhagi]
MWFFRLVPAFALLALSGCQLSHQPAPAHPDSAARCSGTERARCAWVNEIEQRVSRHFDRADRYRGQRCDVTIGYDPRRGYQVLRTEGDEALCLKAWQAVSSDRQLPTPPAGAPQNIMVTFRPG